MAYETYAILKRKVANRLGKTNDATADALRDNAVNDAIQQIYQDARFSWLLKRSTTISLVSGVANCPADFSPSLGFKVLMEAVTGPGNDKIYTRVDPIELDSYDTSNYVYAILWDAAQKLFTIVTNQTSTVTMSGWYYQQLAELSSSTDVTPIPDAMAIAYLATALWWLASERDEDEFDRFTIKYKERLELMKGLDGAYNTGKRSMGSKIDTGSVWNPSSTRR